MGNSKLDGDTPSSEAILSEAKESTQVMPPALDVSSDLVARQTALANSILTMARRGDSVEQLLQWVPDAVAESFVAQGCRIELYDSRDQTLTLVGTTGKAGKKDRQPRSIGPVRDLYKPLTLGQSTQFRATAFGAGFSPKVPLTWLGCPMMKPTGLLGGVWLTRPEQKRFSEGETTQLQLIANCVAIALHQSQLDQIVADQVAEIQQLRKAKDEFLQLISHELFVPLGNIQLSTQTLERIFKDVSWRKVPQRSRVLKVLSLLSQECRRQKQFVDNLITLMFPDYQKRSEPVLMNLSDWLPSLLRTFEPRFEQESLKLKIDMPEDPLLLECDVAQLERIITELITNTLKYTPDKKAVSVTVQKLPAAVEIAIANTGVHIPPQHQSRIFEKFYRISELDQRHYGGSGLGLSLVKQLVANLDGTIQVKSTKQKTTFTVRLPK